MSSQVFETWQYICLIAISGTGITWGFKSIKNMYYFDFLKPPIDINLIEKKRFRFYLRHIGAPAVLFGCTAIAVILGAAQVDVYLPFSGSVYDAAHYAVAIGTFTGVLLLGFKFIVMFLMGHEERKSLAHVVVAVGVLYFFAGPTINHTSGAQVLRGFIDNETEYFAEATTIVPADKMRIMNGVAFTYSTEQIAFPVAAIAIIPAMIIGWISGVFMLSFAVLTIFIRFTERISASGKDKKSMQ